MNQSSGDPLTGKPPTMSNQPTINDNFLNNSVPSLQNAYSNLVTTTIQPNNQTNTGGYTGSNTNLSQSTGYQQPFAYNNAPQQNNNSTITKPQTTTTMTVPDKRFEAIQAYMTKNNIKDMDQLFNQVRNQPGGVQSISKQELMFLLTAPSKLNLQTSDADEFAKQYLLSPGSPHINYTNFKKDFINSQQAHFQLQQQPQPSIQTQNIQQQQQPTNNVQQNQQQQQQLQSSTLQQNTNQQQIQQQQQQQLQHQQDPQAALNQIFEGLKHYLVINGGTLLHLFRELDTNEDLRLPAQEFKSLLFYRLNTSEIYTEQHIDTVIQKYTQNSNDATVPYLEFLKAFYEYANKSRVKDQSDNLYQIFENLRNYVRKQNASLASIFADTLMSHQKQKDMFLDFQAFKEQLRFAKIFEGMQFNYMMEQRLFTRLEKQKNQKVDFFYLADLLGYDHEDFAQVQANSQYNFGSNISHSNNFGGGMNQSFKDRPQSNYRSISGLGGGGGPPGLGDSQSMKFGATGYGMGMSGMGGGFQMQRDQKKFFFRHFCRHMKRIVLNAKFIEDQMAPNATKDVTKVQLNVFTNMLINYCHGSEITQKDIIYNVARSFDKGNTEEVSYIDFCTKLQFEVEKLAFLEQFYWKMKESLEFRGSVNLYDMLSQFDAKRDKKFSGAEIQRLFTSKGMNVTEMELSYMFDEYDPKKLGYIEFNELDRDYQEFLEWFNYNRPQARGGASHIYTLGQILQMIQSYSNRTGKSLRVIFKKTRPGESDAIDRFDFTKILTEISDAQLNSDSIDRFAMELDHEGRNAISFSELLKLYNDFFRIRDDGYDDQYRRSNEQKVIWHIANKIADPNSKLTLETHFQTPTCNIQQFVSDLQREPLQCHRIVTREQLQELANNYKQGLFINTSAFIQEVEEKVRKLHTKQKVFKELKQHLNFRGANIEEIFENIKGLGKLRGEENLAPEEFYAVFASIDFTLDKETLWDVLDTMQKDAEGKVSYVDFSNDFKALYETKTGKGGGLIGTKYFQNANEIISHIAQLIVKKGLSKTLGSYLAGYDLNGTGKIERDAFYRVLESMSLGLGEGDIQTLLKTYDQLNQNQIVLQNFVNDVNRNIFDPNDQVQLKSLIGQTINERIVEPATPTPKLVQEKHFQATVLSIKLIKDIHCGLFCRNKTSRDLGTWFTGYSRTQGGHLTQNELFAALDQLTVAATTPEKTQFVEDLLKRQEQQLGFKSSQLNLEFLIQQLTRDFHQSKDQLLHEILFEIAEHLTNSRIPIKDQFKIFDQNSLGFVLNDAFKENILENYLGLRQVLTPNKSSLLVKKYDPNSQFRIYYDQFINDLKSIELQNSKIIRLYMTQSEVDHDTSQQHQHNLSQDDQQYQSQQMQKQLEIQLEAKSKKNTVITEKEATKTLHLQVPTYQLEDIMIATCKRGKSVEAYFKDFSTWQRNQFVMELDQFYEALKKLGLRWAALDQQQKVQELFEAIDTAAHMQMTRTITIEELGLAVLQNASCSILDIQAKYVEDIHAQLKQRNLLPKMRDIFTFLNVRRDNTTSAKEFKQVLLEQLNLKQNVTETQIDLLIQRYKTTGDAQRISFSKFLKDIELWDKGVSPALQWASEFAEDFLKALVVAEYTSLEQFLQRYQRMQGIILYEEFKKAVNDLQIGLYHDESEQREFFNHVDMAHVQSNRLTANTIATKVSINQLADTIKKLCSKTTNQMGQEVLERIYVHSKNMNMSLQVFHIFNEFDPNKSGQVSLQDFKYAIEMKLNARDVKQLDIDFLAQKYKLARSGPQGMIVYEKFFVDYEKLEKMGFRAIDDPLKKTQLQQSMQSTQQQQQYEIPPESKDLYLKMSRHLVKQGTVDQFGDELVKRDDKKNGYLTEQQIYDAFVVLGLKLSRTKQNSQMSHLLAAVPQDKNNGYYYFRIIELLFGREKLLQIAQKYALTQLIQQQSQNPGSSTGQQYIDDSQLIMQQRFKEQIELRLMSLQAYVQQVSKGSWLLREQEFYNLFSRSMIGCNQKDVELLQLFFRKFSNKQSLAVDFRLFIQHYQIQDYPSKIFAEIEKEILTRKINLVEIIQEEIVTFEIFQNAMKNLKIDLQLYPLEQVKQVYQMICEGKNSIDKNDLVRCFGGQYLRQKAQEEQIPYIVNELVYYIVNNNINIFEKLNPQVKVLTKQEFMQLLTIINYKTSRPKDMDTLLQFMKGNAPNDQVSVERLILTLRRVDPQYGALQATTGGGRGQGSKKGAPVKNDIKSVQVAQQKVAQFNQKIKQTLQKLNAHFKKNNLNINQVYQIMDKNKNGLCEKEEFIQAITTDMKVEGVLRAELETLYDSLDMNRDGFISVNEFCLYLEGIAVTMEQRLKNLDPQIEKELMLEIDYLFQIFDQNGDGRITTEEVLHSLKAVNQNIALKDAQDMVNYADKNKNGFLEKQEFYQLMLPTLKEEMLMNENNLDELRRLFKEADVDQSNYLSRQELQQVLVKIGVDLTDQQMTELMNELDFDHDQSIDIDEFVAYLAVADQVKFKNPSAKLTLLNIRRARKLHPIDFYNCFKNLPSFFTPAFTQNQLEKQYLNTPSYGIYPQFDSKSMTYKELAKITEIGKVSQKRFIELYMPSIGCEIQLEEANGVPLPKQTDFDWNKIINREIRAVLYDFQNGEFVSNSFILQAYWKEEFANKWLFNYNQNHTNAKNFLVKTDILSRATQQFGRNIHLLFELVLYTNQQDQIQQVSCGWGTIPITQLDKAAKQKVNFRGGTPFQEKEINSNELFQQKKKFSFIGKTVSSSDFHLILSVKPSTKFTEQTLFYMSVLPDTCLVPKRLLSFAAAFRVYCYRKLNKPQQQMMAPQGNFVIAQFRKIFDNPDTNFLMGDCWDIDINTAPNQQQLTLDVIVQKMEEYIQKLYSIIYAPEYQLDHVYPTRSSSIMSDLFQKREALVKQVLIPAKYKPILKPNTVSKGKQQQSQQVIQRKEEEDYKPFNIQEMEIELSGVDTLEAKQDEIIKMFMQMGLIQ